MNLNFPQFFNQIISLLEENLILPDNGLKAIYDDFNKYANGEQIKLSTSTITHFRNPFLELLNQQGNELTTVAIDFPIFFKSLQNTDETIMICAMDPLPPLPENNFWLNKQFIQGRDVSLWVPFSLIDNWNNPLGSMRTNIPFFSTLIKNYNLYITDIYKVFYRKVSNNKYSSSNQIKSFTELSNSNKNNIHSQIVSEEIQIVNPKAIVTLGNKSRNALLSIQQNINGDQQTPFSWGNEPQKYLWNNKTKIISLPHISGAANGSKQKLVKNTKYDDINTKYQNEKIASILLRYIE